MTIQNEVYREDYSGNDSTTSFPVSFYFFDDAHLRVLLLDAAGVETLQVLNTDYTVIGAGNPAGGSVEMVVPPAIGETLTIIRNVPFTQLLDYIENDNFPAQSHENGLDKLTMIVQQQQEEVDRTFRIAPSYLPATDFELIPAANGVLLWNDTADKIVTTNEIQALSGGGGQLLYNESPRLTAYDIGVRIEDGIAAGFNIFYSGQHSYLQNYEPSGNVYIRGRNSGNTASHNILFGNPDAGTTLYYDGIESLSTIAGGIRIIDTGGQAVLEFHNGANILAEMFTSGNDFYLDLEMGTDGDVYIRTFNGLISEPMIWCEGGGGVNLYYDGERIVYTHATGIRAGVSPFDILDSANNLAIEVVTAGQVRLSYNGSERLRTATDGILIGSGVATGLAITYLSDDAFIDNLDPSGELVLRVRNGINTVNQYAVRAIPDGSVSLYYNNNEALRTLVNGIQITAGPHIINGAGDPQGVITAPVGSIYFNVNGGANTTFYVKESGVGNTGWVAK